MMMKTRFHFFNKNFILIKGNILIVVMVPLLCYDSKNLLFLHPDVIDVALEAPQGNKLSPV